MKKINWCYFSDTNAPANLVEELLQKRQSALVSFNRSEDLYSYLKMNDSIVLFMKTNVIYNIYELCQEISIKFPYVYIVLMPPDTMINIKKAMHAGASNMITQPQSIDEIQDVIVQAEKYMTYRMNQENYSSYLIEQNSRVISVSSTKGGIGRTAVSVNLAAAFVKNGKRTAILDANLQFGDVAMYYDIKPKQTIYEWVKEGYERNYFSLDKYMVKHVCGASILAAPLRPEFFEMISDEHIKRAIDELKLSFDIVIIDTPSYLCEILLACLEKSDDVLLLTTNELPTLRRTKLLLDTFQSFQLNADIKIINREMPKKRMDTKKIEQVLEQPIFAGISHQENIAVSSINEGIPYVLSQSKTPIAKSIFSLVNQLSGSDSNPVNTGSKKYLLINR
ncbi:AAA family ATPase [Fictibacillus sp. b24]|uniref:AAA family ATPase n=1 Tax=Fictibacillus sp. b24 TaxID=3055863 RepID=UPI0025A0314C|nr:AAA family ATPase [Fictibacillus sp. b24]MDM5314865.1 AAA family ATPase [Fictibacillus sp. b24]